MNILGTVFVLACTLMVSACWTNGGDAPPMASVVSLSQKVEALAPDCVDEYTQPVPQEVVDQALASNPNLASTFADYQVKARMTACNAVILVCSSDGEVGLAEDAGCNGMAERNDGERLSDQSPPASCEFTLRVDKDCQLIE